MLNSPNTSGLEKAGKKEKIKGKTKIKNIKKLNFVGLKIPFFLFIFKIIMPTIKNKKNEIIFLKYNNS